MADPGAKSVECERYHGLDALRGILMLIGVLVHVATLGVNPVYDSIARASGLFRMETFFVVSGFLSALLAAKYGGRPTVRRRFVAVGVPLLATLLVLNPPTLWMSYVFHTGRDRTFGEWLAAAAGPALTGGLNWYLHLWFLLVLLGYALLTPLAVRLLTALVATGAYRRATTGRVRCLTAITVASLVLVAAGRGLWSWVIEPVTGSGFHADLPRRVLEFLPFFLLGILLYLDRIRIGPLFRRPAPVLLAVSAVLLAASWGRWVDVIATGTGRALVETLFAIPVISLLFAAAERFCSRPRPVLQYLSGASYTVYLFHFFWIFVLARVLGLDPSLGFGEMTLLIVLTYAATFATHHFVILRSRCLQVIFNGRPASPRRPPSPRPASANGSRAASASPSASSTRPHASSARPRTASANPGGTPGGTPARPGAVSAGPGSASSRRHAVSGRPRPGTVASRASGARASGARAPGSRTDGTRADGTRTDKPGAGGSTAAPGPIRTPPEGSDLVRPGRSGRSG